MFLGVDARPLEHPQNGIGRYTLEILKQISYQTSWSMLLLTNELAEVDIPRTTILPVDTILGSHTAYFYARAAKHRSVRSIDCFFSPRHHLPFGLEAPAVVTIHDVVWARHPETMKPANRWLERFLMPPAVRKATAIIAVSDFTRRELACVFPATRNKTSVVHEASALHPEEGQTFSRRRPYILAVGTQEPRKNYSRLLVAFRSITLEFPDLNLVIAGGNGWKSDLENEIRNLGLQKRVSLKGGISDAELSALYANSEFLALPSLYEGFGLPLIEAMRFGKPILTSNAASMPEVVGDAAVLVDPLDVQSIANGMLRILKEPALRDQLSERSKARSSTFGWEKAGRETIEVIQSVAS